MKRMSIIAVALVAVVFFSAARKSDIWRRKPFGMVLGFDFSGTRVTTPDGQTGTLNGNATVAAGTRYLALDGTGDYLSIPRSAATNNIATPSYTFWLYPTTLPSGTLLKRIYTKASTNVNGTSIWAGKITGVFSNGIGFNVQNATQADEWYADSVLTAATWQHVVCTWDGSGGSAAVKIYINGISVTVVQRQSGLTTYDDSGNDILLGIRSGLFDNGFDGRLADFRVYNRVLTSAEAAQLYNAGAARIANGGTP